MWWQLFKIVIWNWDDFVMEMWWVCTFFLVPHLNFPSNDCSTLWCMKKVKLKEITENLNAPILSVPKKKTRAWQQFRSVRCRRETFHAEIGTFKWPSERAGQRQGKLSRHYSNSVFVSPSRSLPSPVRRCLPSLTLTCSQTELPSTHGNSCEETVLSVERGQIPHGGGGGGPAREENCGPGQRVEIREEKWLPFEPSVTSQLHTKSKSRLSRTCTDNLPLTLL